MSLIRRIDAWFARLSSWTMGLLVYAAGAVWIILRGDDLVLLALIAIPIAMGMVSRERGIRRRSQRQES